MVGNSPAAILRGPGKPAADQPAADQPAADQPAADQWKPAEDPSTHPAQSPEEQPCRRPALARMYLGLSATFLASVPFNPSVDKANASLRDEASSAFDNAVNLQNQVSDKVTLTVGAQDLPEAVRLSQGMLDAAKASYEASLLYHRTWAQIAAEETGKPSPVSLVSKSLAYDHSIGSAVREASSGKRRILDSYLNMARIEQGLAAKVALNSMRGDPNAAEIFKKLDLLISNIGATSPSTRLRKRKPRRTDAKAIVRGAESVQQDEQHQHTKYIRISGQIERTHRRNRDYPYHQSTF